MKAPNQLHILAGGAVLLMVGAYFLQSRLTNMTAGAVVGLGNAAAGVPIGIGDLLGLPRTNETDCEKALREGRTWDASFVCPAKDWVRGVFD